MPIGEVYVRNFEGNDQYAPGTVEPLENQDIFYGIFSEKYFVSPSVQFLKDFRDVEHALQNTSRIDLYPILFAKCVHVSELKLQSNQSLIVNVTGNITGENTSLAHQSNYTEKASSMDACLHTLRDNYTRHLQEIPEMIGFSMPMISADSETLMGLTYDSKNVTAISIQFGAVIDNSSLWIVENTKVMDYGGKYNIEDDFYLHINMDGFVNYHLNGMLLYRSRSILNQSYRIFLSSRQQQIVGPAKIKYFERKSILNKPCIHSTNYSREWIVVYDEGANWNNMLQGWSNGQTLSLSNNTLVHGIYSLGDLHSINVRRLFYAFPPHNKIRAFMKLYVLEEASSNIQVYVDYQQPLLERQHVKGNCQNDGWLSIKNHSLCVIEINVTFFIFRIQ